MLRKCSGVAVREAVTVCHSISYTVPLCLTRILVEMKHWNRFVRRHENNTSGYVIQTYLEARGEARVRRLTLFSFLQVIDVGRCVGECSGRKKGRCIHW